MNAPLLWHYPLFAGLGVVLGAVRRPVQSRPRLAASDLFAAWSRRAGWTLVLALSLGLTALLFVAPAATGGGEQIVQPLMAEHREPRGPASPARPAGRRHRWPATPPARRAACSRRSSALATVAGLAYAEAATSLLPGLGLEPAAFAAAAMAALFTGSVRAPLVGVVLVAELTDAYPALLAITLSSAMASLTAAAPARPPALRAAARAKPAVAAVNQPAGAVACIEGLAAKSSNHAASAGRRSRQPKVAKRKSR